jgi:acetyl-CoA acyltransferase
MPMHIVVGWTAEQVARKYNISREIQDQFACESHKRCAQAQDANGGLGKTKDVVVPIKCMVPAKGANIETIAPQALYTAPEGLAKKRVEEGITDDVEMVVWRDQGLRRETTMESLAKMAPVFIQDELASVTAGNASQINDAVAGLVLATAEGCKALGVKPKMKMIGSAVIGLDPQYMGIGPALAIPMALKRAGITQEQVGLWEVNEAFASQAYYCCHDALKLPMDRVNVWGSGISIGHPLACTGARIACDITALFADPDFSVNKVVPHEDLYPVVYALADQLANGPSITFRYAKQLLRACVNNDFAAIASMEAGCQVQCWSTDDFREGVQAFLDKRKPIFKNQ